MIWSCYADQYFNMYSDGGVARRGHGGALPLRRVLGAGTGGGCFEEFFPSWKHAIKR
jgi:hypothetical protein